MSITRAFTTRRMKMSVDLATPQRSNTSATRPRAESASIRNKISGPMELTHTTNMLAYNAPDLYPRSASSTASSTKSDDDESDALNTSSPPTSPDVSKSEDEMSASPEPNHLSCYFAPPGKAINVNQAPAIPRRSPSHTKKASIDNLSRQQSLRLSNHSNLSSSTKPSYSLSRTPSASTTATSVSAGSITHKHSASSTLAPPVVHHQPKRADIPETHPFGQELAQVTEVAEVYGQKARMEVIDEEEQELRAQGLAIWKPEDYVSEIQGLFSTFFGSPHTRPSAPVWI